MKSSASLRCVWHDGPDNGYLAYRLTNDRETPLCGFTLCTTSQNFPENTGAAKGAQICRIDGSFLEVAPPEGMVLAPGDSWEFTLQGHFAPRNQTDGPLSAFIALKDGQVLPVAFGALECSNPTGPEVAKPAPDYTGPMLALTPWPNGLHLTGTAPAPSHFAADAPQLTTITNLLFPKEAPIFSTRSGGMAFRSALDKTLAAEEYEITFHTDQVDVRHGEKGLLYAQITLAQLLRGCRLTPRQYTFPAAGSKISDAPAFDWRGAQLDVSRQFFSPDEIRHFLAGMAWAKLNRFHWHLSDDEGFRIEIKAFPALTQIGACRGYGQEIPPQLGDGPAGQAGFYTQLQVQEIICLAADLNIEVMPEIDMPGHATAILRALPYLADPDETANSYRSVQSFYNNALNPAMPQVEHFVDAVLAELTALFPFGIFHIGGDEVPENAWTGSPVAQTEMARYGESSEQMQGRFTRALQDKLQKLGKATGAWDEVGHAKETRIENTLVFLWRDATDAAMLAKRGFDIILTPASYFYLDMCTSNAWGAPGAGWAGVVPLQKTYDYVIPTQNVKGVQAGIWTEKMQDRKVFRTLVFPRLYAVAETGWTLQENKDFGRFDLIIGHNY